MPKNSENYSMFNKTDGLPAHEEFQDKLYKTVRALEKVLGVLPAMKLLANLERTTIKTLQFLAYILRIIVQIQV